MSFDVEVLSSIAEVDASDWNRLIPADNPFIEHAFLLALESSHSVGDEQSGWVPQHLVCRNAQKQIVAALPLYLKFDSYGEFIFDFMWAQAALRAGIAYYPKLVSAVPFTPVTVIKLLCDAKSVANHVHHAVFQALDMLSKKHACSSVHALFIADNEQATFARDGFIVRDSLQYHWQRSPEWHTFSDYLADMRSIARKQINRERRRAQSHGFTLSMKQGTEMNDNEWRMLWVFYLSTVDKRGGHPYLTQAFFTQLRVHMPERVLVAWAHKAGEPVAASLFLQKGAALYGRDWGALGDWDSLHFELCYYLPIEWALAHGITRIEAGAQGEHKIKRGFLPALCYSAHKLDHNMLHRAVSDFVEHERAFIQRQKSALEVLSPFHRAASID